MPQKHESTKSLKGQIYWLLQLGNPLCLSVFVAKKFFEPLLYYKVFFLLIVLFFIAIPGFTQIKNVEVTGNEGISISKIETQLVTKSLENIPLVSFKIGDKLSFSNQKESFENQFQIEVIQPETKNNG